MPYVRCPGCALDTYSAACHSTTDECPRCGARLDRGVRWDRVDGVLVLRSPRIAEPDPPAAAPAEPDPAAAIAPAAAEPAD